MEETESLRCLQADMRAAYACGAPGALVSGLVWLAASAASPAFSVTVSIWVLLVGGIAIFPLSLLICRIVGVSGKHTTGNPLGCLAMEGTASLMVGIFISMATLFTGTALFFPVMLLVIGSRYLTFQTVYGLRHYWFAGAALCITGFTATILNFPSWVSAGLGGSIEIVLAAALFTRKHASQGSA